MQVKNRATVAAEALEQAQALREALAASIMPDADAGQRQHLQTVERDISRWVVAGGCKCEGYTDGLECGYITLCMQSCCLYMYCNAAALDTLLSWLDVQAAVGDHSRTPEV